MDQQSKPTEAEILRRNFARYLAPQYLVDRRDEATIKAQG